MKRPCAREFGIVRMILAEDDKGFEVRAYSRTKRQNINDTLGVYTTKDADRMIQWLEKAKEYLESRLA